MDKWKEIEIENEESGIPKIKDAVDGEQDMETKDSEKYLGDIISTDGKNLKNIKARVTKGTGIISKIITMMEGIPFGKFYYQVGIILRNSLLVSSLLCNSEAWYNVTNSELELLESVDLRFLRSLLKAPRATPKEMIYLELGCVPLRELIIKRRILFLHYILNESESSIILKFFNAQLKNRRPKDWVSSVLKDLQNLKIEQTFSEIKGLKKNTLKRVINKAIISKAFERLINLKENHSKVKHLAYSNLKMQNYLKPSRVMITQNEIQTIFKLRSRVTDVKQNFKAKYENLECRNCKVEEESQHHVYECWEIIKNKKDKTKMIEFDKIFGENSKYQAEIARNFLEILEIRRKIQ